MNAIERRLARRGVYAAARAAFVGFGLRSFALAAAMAVARWVAEEAFLAGWETCVEAQELRKIKEHVMIGEWVKGE